MELQLDVNRLAPDRRAGSYTVDQMKAYARELGVSTAGNKPDLYKRLIDLLAPEGLPERRVASPPRRAASPPRRPTSPKTTAVTRPAAVLPVVTREKIPSPPPVLPIDENPRIDPGTPIDDFVSTVIKEQDSDKADEKEYLGYVRYLLDADDKYDIFARIYPQNTCENVSVRVEGTRAYIRPDPDDLQVCVKSAETADKSVAVRLSYQNHANSLWFDTKNKVINRYDPQVPGDEYGQSSVDTALRNLFAQYFTDYNYLGNTLEGHMCVQGVRHMGRRHKADYFCQDYSLLYAKRRAEGMSHEESAWDLVEKRDTILNELAELLRILSYKKRAELGRPVPAKYQALWPKAKK